MATISRLSVSLIAKTTGLRRGLRRAQRSVKAFAGKIANLKTAIVGTLGALAIGKLTSGFISAFEKQDSAVAKLDASIESMGRTTRNLSRDIQKLASEVQGEGIIGDEALIEGASFLTTYRDITDDMLPRTVRIMADLAAKMGGDTTRAANLLGKASMGLVGSLSIAGISLSDATKESKDFQAILNEVESQVGGTNKALGDTPTGALKQFSNAFGDLKENAGEVLANVLAPGARVLSARMSELKIDMESLIDTSRMWFITSLRGLGRMADAWNGIRLVIKTLKLGFIGFGFLVTEIIQGIANQLQRLGDLIGKDVVSRVINREALMVTKAIGDDLRRDMERTKKEIAQLTDDVTTNKASRDMKKFLDDFVRESKEIAEERGGKAAGQFYPQPPPTPGVLHKLEVNDDGRIPQIDQTNTILKDIRRGLTNQFAVAG